MKLKEITPRPTPKESPPGTKLDGKKMPRNNPNTPPVSPADTEPWHKTLEDDKRDSGHGG